MKEDPFGSHALFRQESVSSGDQPSVDEALTRTASQLERMISGQLGEEGEGLRVLAKGRTIVVYGVRNGMRDETLERLNRIIDELGSSYPVRVRLKHITPPEQQGFSEPSLFDLEEGADPGRRRPRVSHGQLDTIINKTLPLGVYPLKITPFECALPRGVFRAIHLKVDVPPEKQEAFDQWVEQFEGTYGIRIHARKEWAREGIDRFLNRIAPERQLLTTQDVPALAARLERFHRLPPRHRKETDIPMLPLEKGRDLLHVPFVTIDEATTLDMEDAIAAVTHPDGTISLYVSIIDVSWYVKRGGIIDRYTSSRAYSVYGSHAAFPLLGREFSFAEGSFVESEPRLAWTFEFTIAPSGEIVERDVYRAAMKSYAKLTVEHAHEMLHGVRQATNRDGDVLPIRDLAEAAHRLWRSRTSSGEFLVLDSGERTADRIVQECMITANIEAADLFVSQGWPALFTTYTVPSAAQKEQLAKRCERVGVHALPSDFDDPVEFSRIWVALRDEHADSLLGEMLDRFFPRSVFGTLPDAHQGIPARSYLRLKGNTYVGIVNQWILEALTDGRESPFSHDDLERISLKQNRQMRSYDSVSLQVRLDRRAVRRHRHGGSTGRSAVRGAR
jgi:hypothetical protein